MPLDDHTLLLQLERANEALSDRVDAVEEHDDDPDRDYCDCNCHEDDVFDLRTDTARDIEGLRTTAEDLNGRVAQLEEDAHDDNASIIKILSRLQKLEANLQESVDILTGAVERVDALENIDGLVDIDVRFRALLERVDVLEGRLNAMGQHIVELEKQARQ